MNKRKTLVDFRLRAMERIKELEVKINDERKTRYDRKVFHKTKLEEYNEILLINKQILGAINERFI